MQRALTSIVRRSLLQQRTCVVAKPSSSLFIQASSSLLLHRQFSVSSIKLSDNFAADNNGSSGYPSLGGEGSLSSSSTPSYSSSDRPDAKLGLFVGGLDYNATGEDLKRVFSQFGEVTQANVLMDRDTQRSKRFGFVYFTNEAPVEKLLDDPTSLEQLTELGPSPGIERITRREREPRQDRGGFGRRDGGGERRAPSSKGEPTDTLFITGFPREMSRAQLEEVLSEFYPSEGIVKDIRIPVNRIERIENDDTEAGLQNKGYAFIRMGNEEEAQQLLSALIEAAKAGFAFPGSDRAPSFRFASPSRPAGGREGGALGGSSRFGGDGGRGGRSRFGDGQQRRTNNSWMREERSRFQGGRGDDF